MSTKQQFCCVPGQAKKDKFTGYFQAAHFVRHGLQVSNQTDPSSATQSVVQVAAEVRIPVPLMKKQQTQVYAFAKHGTDLGSSKDVKGNPTEFFQRAGHGSSYSVGVKLGPIRAEYAVDHNAGTGALFFRVIPLLARGIWDTA